MNGKKTRLNRISPSNFLLTQKMNDTYCWGLGLGVTFSTSREVSVGLEIRLIDEQSIILTRSLRF